MNRGEMLEVNSQDVWVNLFQVPIANLTLAFVVWGEEAQLH